MSENAVAPTRCSRCGTRIEECVRCDEPDCGAAICYRCLNVAIGQQKPQPHVHGG